MEPKLSRRTVLAAGSALLAQALPSRAEQAQPEGKLKVAIFSKHLPFLHGDALPAKVAELGYDGIDLTVRKGGHVAPERVREDLPPLAAAIRKHGLDMPLITTDIVDADTPHAVEIVQTMAELGIRRYRWMPPGALKYNPEQPYPAQLEALKPRVAKLEALNRKYNVCAMWHTHSGVAFVGQPIWDLFILMRDFDPNRIAVNYDIGHATIEGGVGGWGNSFHVITPHLRGIAVKDFLWAKDAKGAWKPTWQPLGEGMVKLAEFLKMVKASGFDGPVQQHFEYPLHTPAETYAAMRRDLAALRSALQQADL